MEESDLTLENHVEWKDTTVIALSNNQAVVIQNETTVFVSVPNEITTEPRKK